MNTNRPSRLIWWFVVPAGIIAGVLTTVQSQINAELKTAIDDATVAAVISFASGLVLLITAVGLHQPSRAKFAGAVRGVRSGSFPWWMTLGGAGGAIFVYSQGAAVSALGIALFSVVAVASQTIGSFIWDHFGVGPSGKHPFTLSRVLGAFTAVIAVAITVVTSHNILGQGSWLVVLPLAAGIATSWQQAANGRVRVFTNSPLVTTFWNFVVGMTVLTTLMLLERMTTTWPNLSGVQWWMLLGGPIGIGFIATLAIIVKYTGVLLATLLTVLGQLTAAVALAPIMPNSPQPNLGTYVGVGLALFAVGIMILPGRRTRA